MHFRVNIIICLYKLIYWLIINNNFSYIFNNSVYKNKLWKFAINSSKLLTYFGNLLKCQIGMSCQGSMT